MISIKDKLLNHPWDQMHYNNHRRKVRSAKPAIDTTSPISRQHVKVKLKKHQKELERCKEIEKNNFILLRKMSQIMQTSRVDNKWKTPQPNFLNRVELFDKFKPVKGQESDEETTVIEDKSSRKSRCSACTPRKTSKIQIPEERVPWETPKKLLRERSKSVPIRQNSQPMKMPNSADASRRKTRQNSLHTSPIITSRTTQSLLLKRGSLNLSINFPSDTFVSFQKGSQEKVLANNYCNCKSRL